MTNRALIQVVAASVIAQPALAPVAVIDSEASRLAEKRNTLFKSQIMFVMQIPAGEKHAANEDLARVHRIVNAFVEEKVLDRKFRIQDALIGKDTELTRRAVAELQKKLGKDTYSPGHEGKFDALTLTAVQGWAKRKLVEQAAAVEAAQQRQLKLDAAQHYMDEKSFYVAAGIYIEVNDKKSANSAALAAAKEEKFDEALKIANELLKDKALAKTIGAMKLKRERELAAQGAEKRKLEEQTQAREFIEAQRKEIDALRDQKDVNSRQWKDALKKLGEAGRLADLLESDAARKRAEAALASAKKAPDKLIDLGEATVLPAVASIVITDEHVRTASGQAHSKLGETDELLKQKAKQGFDVTALRQRYDQLGVDFDAVKRLKKNADKKAEFERIAEDAQVIIDGASVLVKVEALPAKSREDALIEMEQRLRGLLKGVRPGTTADQETYLILLRLHEQGIIKTKPGKNTDDSEVAIREMQKVIEMDQTSMFGPATADRLLSWVVNQREFERLNRLAQPELERLDGEAMAAIESIPIGDAGAGIGINTPEYNRTTSLVGHAQHLKSDSGGRRYSEAKEKYLEAKEAALAYAAIVRAHGLIKEKTKEFGADAVGDLPSSLQGVLTSYRETEKLVGYEERVKRYRQLAENVGRIVASANGIRRIEAVPVEEPKPKPKPIGVVEDFIEVYKKADFAVIKAGRISAAPGNRPAATLTCEATEESEAGLSTILADKSTTIKYAVIKNVEGKAYVVLPATYKGSDATSLETVARLKNGKILVYLDGERLLDAERAEDEGVKPKEIGTYEVTTEITGGGRSIQINITDTNYEKYGIGKLTGKIEGTVEDDQRTGHVGVGAAKHIKAKIGERFDVVVIDYECSPFVAETVKKPKPGE